MESRGQTGVNTEAKHVFIIGAKGLGGYGGYETFVKKLLEYTPADGERPLQYHVVCKANGYGASDEAGLPGAERIDDGNFSYRGALCHKIQVPQIGPAQAIIYDYAALRWALAYCRANRIRRPIFYILSCKLGLMIGRLSRRIRSFGGTFWLNPDGQEWRREKWSRPVRAYLRYSESRMVRRADLVICDSREIEKYIRETYGLAAERTEYIAYGAEMERGRSPETEAVCREWLRDRDLTPDGYYLMISRFVPENSFETILREFMRSGTERNLVIIATESRVYEKQLARRLHAWDDRRIHLMGPVYDEALLRELRAQAHGYIHGHRVGGTNPGLLEAMADAKLCLVRDVSFNREVAEDTVMYWTGGEGELASLLDRVDGMTAEELYTYGTRAAARIREMYRWPEIAARYHRLVMENGRDDE